MESMAILALTDIAKLNIIQRIAVENKYRTNIHGRKISQGSGFEGMS
jgi:hypothetical protein